MVNIFVSIWSVVIILTCLGLNKDVRGNDHLVVKAFFVIQLFSSNFESGRYKGYAQISWNVLLTKLSFKNSSIYLLMTHSKHDSRHVVRINVHIIFLHLVSFSLSFRRNSQVFS